MLYIPVDDELVKRGRFVAHWADPSGLLFVHQQEGGGIKALEVGTRTRPTGNGHPHFPQLKKNKGKNTIRDEAHKKLSIFRTSGKHTDRKVC